MRILTLGNEARMLSRRNVAPASAATVMARSTAKTAAVRRARPEQIPSQPKPARPVIPSAANVNSFAGIPKLAKARQNGRQPPVKTAITVTGIAVEADRRVIGRVEGAEVR